MKFTTARRIIKEHKKGEKQYDEVTLAKAHATCAEYHAKIAQGEKFKQLIAEQTLEMQAKTGKKIIPEGMTAEEFAHKQFRHAMNGGETKEQRDIRLGKRVQFFPNEKDDKGKAMPLKLQDSSK